MSGTSRGTGSARSTGSARLPPAAHDLVLDALYDRKRDTKSVRVLTVIIYVFCVSLAAIMLSLYYVFFWEPKDAQYAQRKVALSLQTTTPMPICFMPHTGGSNTTINGKATSSPDLITNGVTSSPETADTTTEFTQDSTIQEDPSPTTTILDNYNQTDYSTYNETNVT